MRRIFILIYLIASFAVASPTANEDFVIAEAAKAYTNAVEAAKKLGGGVDTNAVLGLITSATNELEGVGTEHQIIRGSNKYGPWDITVFNAQTAQTAQGDSDGRSIIDTYAEKMVVNDLHGHVSTLEYHYNDLSGTVSAWQTYWDGDDVRVTVTNYFGNLGIPSLYLEQKMPSDETHESSWFKTIWDERTRWNGFMQTFAALTNDVAQNKADRAWGVYDSSSGEYSPDGLLQLSQEQIMIASGMAWQKTVTAGSAIWVLKATNPTTLSGETENGFFRIEDGDGNALFEIVKGDKRVVGATATGVSMDGTSMRITYAVESAEHPTLEVCTDLRLGDWTTETDTTSATVSWSGSSGDWVANVTPVGARPSLFAKASYEAGGNTYIRNNVATSIDKVVVGGIEYTVTVEMVNGKKLLVLK